MNRYILNDLVSWKSQKKRKPLILKGARQVGKTYALQSFAAKHFQNVFYVNFEKEPEFSSYFEKSLDPQKILQELNLVFKRTLNPETDILILDEIQQCPKAITSLKYFCEELPELAVCAAGSLLGVTLNQESFPVGKVQYLNMYPMTFEEFLQALNEDQLLTVLNQVELNAQIPSAAHTRLWERLKEYFVVGGLPEVVADYVNMQEDVLSAVRSARLIQDRLIKDYYADIAKHSGKVNAMHIDRVLSAVPSQLAQAQDGHSNKFKFKGVVPGVDRYRSLVNVIDWLENAGLIIKVNIVNSAEQPLKAYTKESRFKLYMFDVGILGALSGLEPEVILSYDYGSYKGYFAENFVCQALTAMDSKPLYNWQEGTSEIEFLKEFRGHVVPLEVKAGQNVRAKSLKVYSERYQPENKFILSAKELESRGNLHYLPLYFSSYLTKLI